MICKIVAAASLVALSQAAPAALPSFVSDAVGAGRLCRTCTPQDHGARADGISVDTAAINAAIEACGTVSFPGGGGAAAGQRHYLTGTIRLRSNTRLVLEKGVTVLAASVGHFGPAEPLEPPGALACTITGAPYAPACQDYGHCHWADALITGTNLTNISIVGEGTFDGNHNLRDSCSAAEAAMRPGCKLLGLQSVRGLQIGGVSFKNGGHSRGR
jgi:polygalacturonase